ncbi:hypothetical protein HaLaN_29695 [Haematococcus lacustris]|uniref:Uncharacterized protein n=1 Tax=Haematococcus lacustris TaxID=44745 RepID=A0A6A0AFZ7_HAELA|nr:hypothetical protein HaLaN_29695 [Haematococcus lacustris]
MVSVLVMGPVAMAMSWCDGLLHVSLMGAWTLLWLTVYGLLATRPAHHLPRWLCFTIGMSGEGCLHLAMAWGLLPVVQAVHLYRQHRIAPLCLSLLRVCMFQPLLTC